ncbi:MAG: 3-dehydroquinate synthase [Treponema sp.]|nr:3-dehydroquinate synthase [Treponema sp.]
MPKFFRFQFGNCSSSVIIQKKLPRLEELYTLAGDTFEGNCLAVCDDHTLPLVRRMDGAVPVVALPPGESSKGWAAVETILRAAGKQGLGRDGLFIGAGGGVVCDLTAFAASVYMRGAALVLLPTTLLSMVDASIGGKTGFDLEGIKNLAGTFYPARGIVIAADFLKTLPEREWKSGMAELIKTAVLDGDSGFFDRLKKLPREAKGPGSFVPFIEEAVRIKGRIVERDPRETGTERVLLNLGHTFGHALETSLGLGTISHGEAVAWGMARSCELGTELGLTPPEWGEAVLGVLHVRGYETGVPFPLPLDPRLFRSALFSDKKKKNGTLRFVVPGAEGARLAGWNAQVETYLEKLISKISLSS